ncbi:histidine kinase dimerization/phosphoacceptor domain -containing protein [Calothrix sp. PCC 7507]|uniref:histidine kinase dimerization/phosphoacceptor domain -containing protein n=1 Tax=Calothrix sp. PCC 7507 TaxID=99598 RepID=UPI00029ED0B8|nr:histidine kinase dimerization/phosphoacceptor domain -containing protein [Calothrix sp. PCC 7507]AFY31510.1 signal transduction histidine kinase [Calothrix sp. PCC 7507]
MPVLNYAIHDSMLICAPHTLLKEVIIYMGQAGEYVCVEDQFFQAKCSLDKSYCCQLKVVKEELIPAANSLTFAREFFSNKVTLPVDCIYVVEKSQLLGIFTLADLLQLIHSGINLAALKIVEVMKEPLITLEQDFDVNTTLTLMCDSGNRHLAIVNNVGQLLEIVTPESLAVKLQNELLRTREQLECEIAQRCSLELALKKAEVELEKKINHATEKIVKVNKILQRGICDRVATEAQLLQTNSELQEIFQAFPDLYFRLGSDGTILSYHTRETSEFYLPSTPFIGKRLQDIMPLNVGHKFQQAILQLHQIQSIVSIEYSLPIALETESFEARFLPSIQHQIIVIIRNITESKQAQEALKKAKAELEIRVEERTKELRHSYECLLQETIERQSIEEVLRYRVEFEKLITTISTHFINLAPNEIDQGINQALQAIGEFAVVDRSYVFLFTENYNTLNNIYEWHTQSFEETIYNSQDTPDIVLPWIIEKLSDFETIYIPRINELPIEASQLQKTLINQNIQSLIILPIVCGGLLIGYLEFDSIRTEKIWTEDSIALLKMVGEMLGNALERKRVEQALRVSEERYIRAISAGKVGIWEWNIQTNEIYIDPNLITMLGYTEEEIPRYFDEWLLLIHPDDMQSVSSAVNAYLEKLIPKYEIEHRMLDQNGNYIWFLAHGTLLWDTQGHPCFMAGSNTNITARKQAENKLKSSLKEKEVLLKEIHHRVKNNLQVISSLLRLQARYINDEKAFDIFQDSQNRVRAMAMIHENLYQSNDLAKIEFSDYIQKLTNNLICSYGVKQDIKIHLNIDKILLKIDTAIPCGLIINELISNAIKHAFVDCNKGDIYVDFLDLNHGKYSLNVSDTGVGLQKDIELYKNQSLGLQLVWNLVEQLEGSIKFTQLGTLFTIIFVEQN